MMKSIQMRRFWFPKMINCHGNTLIQSKITRFHNNSVWYFFGAFQGTSRINKKKDWICTCVSSRYCDRDCELSQAEYIAGIWPCSCFFSLIFSFCFSESFRLLKLIGDSTATKSESSFFETNVEEIGFEPRRPDLNSKIKNFIFFSSPILDWPKSLRLLKKDMSFLDYSVRACFNIKSKKNVWMSIYEKNLVSTSFTPVELWSDCTP